MSFFDSKQKQEINELLEGMPIIHRVICILKIMGYTQDEISFITGTSQPTISRSIKKIEIICIK